MRRILFVALAVVAAHAPAGAQERAEAPPRPPLPAEADSNDARAYFRLGKNVLESEPQRAADAFWWASQIDPAWAEPLYGLFAARLLSHPRRLVRYVDGDTAVLASPEVRAMDRLYGRAVRMDPFLQPQFDREILQVYAVAVALGPGVRPQTASSADFYLDRQLEWMHPAMRGRVLAGEGRMLEALEAFDDALRRGRRAHPGVQRSIRHWRARLFAQAGNDSMALAELGSAVHAGEALERGDGLRLYESKAVLEHSQGLLHERRGDLPAAREAYARALVEDLSYYAAHARLGALALAAGDSATGLAELGLAVETAPEEPAPRLAHATLLARLGRFAEAETQALAVTELAPHYADAWLLLALTRDALGEDALPAWHTFVALARRDDPRRTRAEQLLAQRAAAEPAPPSAP
jgi:tetratricopeptide (TPR) repeat protein